MKLQNVTILIIAASLTAFAAEQQQNETQRQEDRALAQTGPGRSGAGCGMESDDQRYRLCRGSFFPSKPFAPTS